MGYRQFIENEFGSYTNYATWLINSKGKGTNRLLKMAHTVATGGAGADVEIEDNAGETLADRSGAGLTLVLASDTDDVLYDGESVAIRYITTLGAKGYCSAAYNVANSTTEVAFTDVATGTIPVVDFLCLDPDYGLLACVSSVAVQAGDNVCVGITGLIAGIADRDIAHIIILAAATSPTAANIYGVGSITGSEAANQADTGYIFSLQYITVYGKVKNATWTFTANSSVVIRFVSVEDSVAAGITLYVNDFYRRRYSVMDHAAIDECRVGDWDAAEFYDAIEIAHAVSCFSRHYSQRESDVEQTILMGFDCQYLGLAAEFATLTLTFTPYGSVAAIPYPIVMYGGQRVEKDLNIRLAPETEVTASVADDAATGGDFTFNMDLIEAY